jgi:hypothetical protein
MNVSQEDQRIKKDDKLGQEETKHTTQAKYLE